MNPDNAAPACFPHLYVHVDTSAEASVVEVIIGASGAVGDPTDDELSGSEATSPRLGLSFHSLSSRSETTPVFRSLRSNSCPKAGSSSGPGGAVGRDAFASFFLREPRRLGRPCAR